MLYRAVVNMIDQVQVALKINLKMQKPIFLSSTISFILKYEEEKTDT